MTFVKTDEELFLAYVTGDVAAFDTLFMRWAPRLTRLFSRAIFRSDVVHELVQQTFLQLHRARNDFRLGAELRPWLVTIALNLRRQYIRRAVRSRETAPLKIERPTDEANAEQRLAARERAHKLNLALSQLPPETRDIIELHWYEDMTYPEIAAIVGASPTAVKVRAHRAYKKLKKMLETQDQPGHKREVS